MGLELKSISIPYWSLYHNSCKAFTWMYESPEWTWIGSRFPVFFWRPTGWKTFPILLARECKAEAPSADRKYRKWTRQLSFPEYYFCATGWKKKYLEQASLQHQNTFVTNLNKTQTQDYKNADHLIFIYCISDWYGNFPPADAFWCILPGWDGSADITLLFPPIL